MANIFEKKTMNGSLVTANTAGIESKAKTRSVNSIIIKTINKGVRKNFPSLRMVKRPPSN